MARIRILLTGIAASGRHGANPGERDAPQAFVVDLDVEVEVDGDELAATADYRALAVVARTAVAGGSFDLLETLAAEVARTVLESAPAARRVRAVVHKPAAARSMGAADVAAEAIAEQGSGR